MIRFHNSVGQLGFLILIPDAQYCASAWPNQFYAMMKFCARRKPDLVVFMGDMVDEDLAGQWSVLVAAVAILDAAGVQYLLLQGNHGNDANRVPRISTKVPLKPWVTTAMDVGEWENTSTMLNLGGRQTKILCLEWGPRNATMAWARAQVDADPTIPTILVTHGYLYRDNRYAWSAYGTAQRANPHDASLGAWVYKTPGEGTSDGEEIWQNLVLGRSNILWVLCGHEYRGRRIDTRADGSQCVQLMSDYQTCAPNGAAYCRELFLDNANARAHMRTRHILGQQYLGGVGGGLAENAFLIPLPAEEAA